jgi:hypothetical protein
MGSLAASSVWLAEASRADRDHGLPPDSLSSRLPCASYHHFRQLLRGLKIGDVGFGVFVAFASLLVGLLTICIVRRLVTRRGFNRGCCCCCHRRRESSSIDYDDPDTIYPSLQEALIRVNPVDENHDQRPIRFQNEHGSIMDVDFNDLFPDILVADNGHKDSHRNSTLPGSEFVSTQSSVDGNVV